jgi:hypothetical protein
MFQKKVATSRARLCDLASSIFVISVSESGVFFYDSVMDQGLRQLETISQIGQLDQTG